MQFVKFCFQTKNPDVDNLKTSIIEKLNNYFLENKDRLAMFNCNIEDVEIKSDFLYDWHLIYINNIFLENPEKIIRMLYDESFNQFYLQLTPSITDVIYFSIKDDEFISGDSEDDIGIINGLDYHGEEEDNILEDDSFTCYSYKLKDGNSENINSWINEKLTHYIVDKFITIDEFEIKNGEAYGWNTIEVRPILNDPEGVINLLLNERISDFIYIDAPLLTNPKFYTIKNGNLVSGESIEDISNF